MLCCQCAQYIDSTTVNLNPRKSAPYDHNTRSSQTDGQTDRRTEEHHGNSAKIHSMKASRAKTYSSMRNIDDSCMSCCFNRNVCFRFCDECTVRHVNIFTRHSSDLWWPQRTSLATVLNRAYIWNKTLKWFQKYFSNIGHVGKFREMQYKPLK